MGSERVNKGTRKRESAVAAHYPRRHAALRMREQRAEDVEDEPRVAEAVICIQNDVPVRDATFSDADLWKRSTQQFQDGRAVVIRYL